MRTTTLVLFRHLLLAVLSASWALAVPIQDTLETQTSDLDIGNIEVDADVELDELLDIDPSLEYQRTPGLEDTSEVELRVDQEVVMELLRRHRGDMTRVITEEEEEDENALIHLRKRRQTTVSGNVDISRQGRARQITGSLNMDHTWDNRHTLSGNMGVTHTRVRGYGKSIDYSGGLRYTYSPNERTSFSIGANKNWGSSGRSHSFGLSFSRRFGRKKRSNGRIKIKCRRNGRCKIKIRGDVSPELVQAALAAVQ